MATASVDEVLVADEKLEPDEAAVERFRRDLDTLIAPDARVGVAVSGGPDSLALLLLTAAARPRLVAAATVDHSLRIEARSEAEMVAEVCERIGVSHQILTIEWQEKPATAIQERARAERYRLLGQWARGNGLHALLTAHHVEDQAETFLMRLARGAGVRGLAAIRRLAPAPQRGITIARPLLGWRRSELEQICVNAGVTPVADPSNVDMQFERVRVRQALAKLDGLSPEAIASSAAHLAEANAAIQWATTQEWIHAVTEADGGIVYRPTNVPREICRRIVARAVFRLATEGKAVELRGSELDRLLAVLTDGGKATLRGVLCSGGAEWRFIPAPNRTRPVDNSH